MIKKLLWKFFPPYEVKLTKAYVNDFFELEDVQPKNLFSGAENALKIIKSEVLQKCNNVDAIIHAVRIEQTHPENIALIQIINTLFWHIGSGNYHIYRNTLKDDGKELLRVFNIANKFSLDKKYSTQEEVNKANSDIRKDISMAG